MNRFSPLRQPQWNICVRFTTKKSADHVCLIVCLDFEQNTLFRCQIPGRKIPTNTPPTYPPVMQVLFFTFYNLTISSSNILTTFFAKATNNSLYLYYYNLRAQSDQSNVCLVYIIRGGERLICVDYSPPLSCSAPASSPAWPSPQRSPPAAGAENQRTAGKCHLIKKFLYLR